MLDRRPIHLWDLATGKERRLAGHPFSVSAVAFSPDGKTLASVGQESVIHFWDLATGRDRLTFPEHESYVKSVTFSPDGRTLATGALDGTVRFWQAATGKPLRRIDTAGRVYQVTFSRDGKLVTAAGEAGPIRVWDAGTGRVVRSFGGTEPRRSSCLFSPDGLTLATGAGDGKIRLWDIATGKELRCFTTDHADAFIIGFSPDGKRLVGGSLGFSTLSGSAASVWDLTTGRRIRHWSLTGTSTVWHFIMAPDGRTVAAGHHWPPRALYPAVHFWDSSTGKAWTAGLPQTGRMFSITASPDGRTLAWGNESGTVVVWEMATARIRRRFEAHRSGICALAFSPDGRVLATGSEDSTALLWDLTGLADAGPSPPPSAEELAQLWTKLGGADAEIAYKAVWRLAATPRQALPWMAEHLRQAAAVDP
jgi:WD40 repeat protein